MKPVLALVCALACANAWTVGLSRRAAVLGAGAAVLLPAQAVLAGEPEPAKMLSEEEMAARVARKAELLKKQDRKGKADAKVLFGAEFQKGLRETKPAAQGDKEGSFTSPILLPGDVGGVNFGR